MSLFVSAWFKEATELLHKFQQESVQRDEKEAEKERTEVKKTIQKELDALKDALGNGDIHFLEYIYKTHKPLNPAHKLLKKHKKNIRKAFREAVIHYHPDKVEEKHGKQLKVLFEEITKMLTGRYECFKGTD